MSLEDKVTSANLEARAEKFLLKAFPKGRWWRRRFRFRCRIVESRTQSLNIGHFDENKTRSCKVPENYQLISFGTQNQTEDTSVAICFFVKNHSYFSESMQSDRFIQQLQIFGTARKIASARFEKFNSIPKLPCLRSIIQSACCGYAMENYYSRFF